MTLFAIRQAILWQNPSRSQPALSHPSHRPPWQRGRGGTAAPWAPRSRPSLRVNTTGSECHKNLGSGASLRGEREGAAALCDRLSSSAYLAHRKPGNLLRLRRGSPGSAQGSGARLEGSRQAAPPRHGEQPRMPHARKEYDADTSRPCRRAGKSRLTTHMASVPPLECGDSRAEAPCAAKLTVT